MEQGGVIMTTNVKSSILSNDQVRTATEIGYTIQSLQEIGARECRGLVQRGLMGES